MKGFWNGMRGRNWRTGLLRLFGWLHCTLIFALYNACITRITEGEAALPGAYCRGFLVVLPLALADLAAKRLPALWQFLLASLALGGLAWLLLGSPFAAIPVLAVCFFRGRARLMEEPGESVFDVPHIPGVLVFLLPFFYSALGGGPLLQKLCWLTAAIYLLLCAAYRGIWRLEDYLLLNRDIAGVPIRRIVRTSGLALAGAVLLAAALFLPALLMDSGYYEIKQTDTQEAAEARMEAFIVDGEIPQLPAELAQMEENDTKIPAAVTYFAAALLIGALFAGVLYGIYRMIREFRGSFTDHRDMVQYLGAEEESEVLSGKRVRKRISPWDRSPSAIVRRKYRKSVLRANAKKEPPEAWASPAEIEKAAGLSSEELHTLYEKARYSAGGCTVQESKSLNGR